MLSYTLILCMKIKKAIWTLILLAMILPELATGSTPLFNFLNPIVLFIVFLGYGITVLLIREVVVRNKLNLFGLFIIGLSYTVLNEGLFAKTLIQSKGLPIALYDNYGYVFGISFPFFITIALFHSLYSVMFPILVTHFYYKEESAVPWLSKKISYVLLSIPFVVGVLNFFGDVKGKGSLEQCMVLFILLCLLLAIGYHYGRKIYKEGDRYILSMKFFWLGVSTFLFSMLLLTIVIAGLKIPIILFLTTAVLGCVFYIRNVTTKHIIQKEALLLFLVGCYLHTTITTFSIVATTNPALLIERIISTSIIFVLLYTIIKKVKSNFNSHKRN